MVHISIQTLFTVMAASSHSIDMDIIAKNYVASRPAGTLTAEWIKRRFQKPPNFLSPTGQALRSFLIG